MSHGGFNLHFYDYSFECLFIFIAQLHSPCCEAIFFGQFFFIRLPEFIILLGIPPFYG